MSPCPTSASDGTISGAADGTGPIPGTRGARRRNCPSRPQITACSSSRRRPEADPVRLSCKAAASTEGAASPPLIRRLSLRIAGACAPSNAAGVGGCGRLPSPRRGPTTVDSGCPCRPAPSGRARPGPQGACPPSSGPPGGHAGKPTRSCSGTTAGSAAGCAAGCRESTCARSVRSSDSRARSASRSPRLSASSAWTLDFRPSSSLCFLSLHRHATQPLSESRS
jgi:hypothetical protein